MARNTENFEPNVTIGDLLVLSRLAVLFYEQHISNPGLQLQSELNVSATRVRNAMLRIDAAVGSVETKGTSRRTQQPSRRGASVGMAGELAKLVIDLSADPRIDQSRLQLEVESILVTLKMRHADGEYDKSTT